MQCVQAATEREVVERLVEADREALRVRTHIVEEILTLKCPRCRKAFVDFEACFALSCSDDRGHGCGSFFCAFRLALCRSEDAHQHVAQCPHNTNEGGDVWGPIGNFEEAQRLRRLRLLRSIWGRWRRSSGIAPCRSAKVSCAWCHLAGYSDSTYSVRVQYVRSQFFRYTPVTPVHSTYCEGGLRLSDVDGAGVGCAGAWG
ncbi:hypothetical protein B484DRAFT_206924 [Ochromonadaceae sp. CCMP2298]|nr:hypothetical protein B484DRAFT_206924 [Ochromonadaceae sp. CCMP2298]